MTDDFRRDIEAALDPHRPGRMTCGFGSDAPGNRPCKDAKCGRPTNGFSFAGYCSTCAPLHGIPLLSVTPSAAEPDEDEEQASKQAAAASGSC